MLSVLGLVIALVIVNSSDAADGRRATADVRAHLHHPLEPTDHHASADAHDHPRLPAAAPAPRRPTPSAPDRPTAPGETETVVYDVDGTGRAISITYVDTGGVLQTEFNVMLPWSKEVELDKPANTSASVNIINVGRELTCSITVGGNVVEHHTGSGLTICGALG